MPRDRLEARPEIFRVLKRLRTRIRQYVFLEGTALVLALLCALFWASLAIDWVYFQLSSLELPVWFRKAFAVGTLCLFAMSLTTWVVLRLVRSLRTKALALVLERRFPELNDRLITAVELSEGTGCDKSSKLTAAMLNRTVDDAALAIRNLELGDVFDKAPLRRAAIAAVVLIASIAAFAWTNSVAMARWTRAYIRWDDQYWKRLTDLDLRIIAQPGDVIRRFNNLVYKHPRGADLTLLVEVPEGKQVPDDVRLEYRLADGRTGGTAYFSKVDDRHFKHTLAGLLDHAEIWVRGGDFATRRPYEVRVVDPPRVDELAFENTYPEYSRMNFRDADNRPIPDRKQVSGTQISLPVETRFVLQGRANKPLVGLRIDTDAFDVEFSAEGARLIIDAKEGGAQVTRPLSGPGSETWFTPGSSEFRLPFVLSAHAAELTADEQAAVPVPLRPDSLVRIYLDDMDEVTSLEPARVMILGIPDQPPVVETELRGVGTSITRQAVVPIAGTMSDDYGLVTGRFDYRIDAAEDWQPRLFASAPHDYPRDFELAAALEKKVERFEVLPLDLKEGQKLVLTVYAEDGDNLNGPHVSRGERFAFQIVSPEELLSILYGKELNLRKRFEQIIQEVDDTQKDLILHRTRLDEADELRKQPDQSAETARKLEEIKTAVAVSGDRSLNQVRKNASETAAVQSSFGEILEELVNNAIHTQQMVDRIEDLIMDPLVQVVDTDFPRADESISLFKLAHEKGRDPRPQIDASVDILAEILVKMRAALAEMQDLVDFHSAVARLESIKQDQEALYKETKRTQKDALIDRLKAMNLE